MLWLLDSRSLNCRLLIVIHIYLCASSSIARFGQNGLRLPLRTNHSFWRLFVTFCLWKLSKKTPRQANFEELCRFFFWTTYNKTGVMEEKTFCISQLLTYCIFKTWIRWKLILWERYSTFTEPNGVYRAIVWIRVFELFLFCRVSDYIGSYNQSYTVLTYK